MPGLVPSRPSLPYKLVNNTVLETCVFALCDAIMLCTGFVLFNLPSIYIVLMILGLFCEHVGGWVGGWVRLGDLAV